MIGLKWHRYEPRATVSSVEEFIAAVDRDPFGCFSGQSAPAPEARRETGSSSVYQYDRFTSRRSRSSLLLMARG